MGYHMMQGRRRREKEAEEYNAQEYLGAFWAGSKTKWLLTGPPNAIIL